MNCKFLFNESRIHDFFFFPGILYYSAELEREKENSIYDKTMEPSYIGFLSKLEKQLEPFETEIKEFYYPDYNNDHDFVDLLFWDLDFFGLDSEENCLDLIKRLSAHEIRTFILSALFSKTPEFTDSKWARMQAEKISNDFGQMRTFVKSLPIEPGAKWQLSLVLEEPVDHASRYVQLMAKLLPLFKQIYRPFIDDVTKYGENLEKVINKDGAKAVLNLTFGIVNPEIFDKDIVYPLLISAIGAYGIIIATSRDNPYIVWGLNAEEAFKRIKELNENKTIEMVTVFKNLGDKTRFEVLKLISSGVSSIKEIAQTLGVSSATVSYHINNLTLSKVLKLNKPGGHFPYIPDYDFLEDILTSFKDNLDFPD